ncbi:hypothetical protein ACWGI8_30215 [Streptomyces sp. NPDC054841]
MISEPELVGGADVPAPRSGEAAAGGFTAGGAPTGDFTARGVSGAGVAAADVLAGGEDESKPPRPRRAWLWALGGAVVASALWAGGLYAYERPGLDLQGYRVSRNLCLDAEFTSLGGALGARTGAIASVDEHVALDRAHCSFQLTGTGQNQEYQVTVSYVLHKKTDPGAEFEVMRRPFAPDGDPREVQPADGLGERAYLVIPTEGYPLMDLDVLDGQAVIRVGVSAVFTYTGEDDTEVPPPDVDELMSLKDHVVEDTRQLIARLKRPA